MLHPRTNLILKDGTDRITTQADAVTLDIGAIRQGDTPSNAIHARITNPRDGLIRHELSTVDRSVTCVLLTATSLPQDLRDADIELRRRELELNLNPGHIGLIPEICTAVAFTRLPQLLKAIDRLSSVTLDIEALSADLGVPNSHARSLQEPLLSQMAIHASSMNLKWSVAAPSFDHSERAILATRAHALGASGIHVTNEVEVAGFNSLFSSNH
jgi:citrate lyase beta subunit